MSFDPTLFTDIEVNECEIIVKSISNLREDIGNLIQNIADIKQDIKLIKDNIQDLYATLLLLNNQ